MIRIKRSKQAGSKSASRSGFSLIEVILATAILMGSVIVLARLVGMGRTQAHKAALHTQSQQLCENTMNELLLGLRPLEPIEREPLLPAESEFSGDLEDMVAEEESLGGRSGLDDAGSLPAGRDNLYGESGQENESEWLYSVRLEEVDLDSGELQKQEFESSTASGLQKLTVEVIQSDESLLRPIRFSLTRWVRTSEMSAEDDFDTFFDSSSGGDQ
ncbi:MAG: prepilin-type N-terminal cleavage/methylation domain-containing protein [Planctomycetaceae bacterium]|nr:prepilin-type N-terminal cleavage/methylation domain-containing protein [Planctomycetaceae bacterium]